MYYLKKLKSILLSNIIFIILIFLIFFSLLRIKFNKSTLNESIGEIYGTVIKFEKKEKGVKFIIKFKEKVLCNYYSDNEINLSLGDKVKVKGSLSVPKNNTIPNNFNYKEYLKSLNIFYVMEVTEVRVLEKNSNWFYKIKNMIISKIEKYNTYDYLNTFVLGNKNYLSDDVYESYRINGVVHLFCISGTHISLLVGIILFIFEKLKLNLKISYFIIFFMLIFYMFLTDYGASVLRSGLFFILLGLKRMKYLKLDTINIFYLTIIILLLFDFNLLKNIGFLYSSSITLGLLLSKRLIKGNYVKKVFIISFISTLISFPITINNFYEINLMGVFYNIIFVPIISFIIMPLAFLVLFFPFLEVVFETSLIVLEKLSFTCNLFQINLVVPKINIFLMIIYYIFVYYFLKFKNKLLLYIALLILIIKFLPLCDYNSYIYYLDVSQGDSTLIKYNNKIILIDTGGVVSFNGDDYRVSDNTITFIKSLGFNKIDFLILTHGDYDHMGDAQYMVDNFKVGRVIFNCGDFNELENELIKVLDKKKIPYYSCIEELNIDGKKLYFLNNGSYDNENDNSSVIYIGLNNHKFLFMGDAGVGVEKDLIEKYNLDDIDVLKVGHHGSKTSSSQEFIDKINPKNSIISVGKNNRYGHPNKEALDNLKNSKIYRTDKEGSIMFKIENSKLNIGTCAP